MPSDSKDSEDLPADATESALHNALKDMHRSGANVQPSSASNDSETDTSTMQGDSSSLHSVHSRQVCKCACTAHSACAQLCSQHSTVAGFARLHLSNPACYPNTVMMCESSVLPVTLHACCQCCLIVCLASCSKFQLCQRGQESLPSICPLHCWQVAPACCRKAYIPVEFCIVSQLHQYGPGKPAPCWCNLLTAPKTTGTHACLHSSCLLHCWRVASATSAGCSVSSRQLISTWIGFATDHMQQIVGIS